ncbi:MAG: orotate phosphoribosyltransferase [Bacteroidales bacterium]|nr:orotate phosphoribosyltransferase [Bacteroidales bacterium]
MIYTEETAKLVALHLLEVKAIKLNIKQPFTWASGLHSPIYCDNRIALSYPVIRTYIRQQLAAAANEYFEDIQMVSGVATAGIPQGVLLAQELGLPFSYVRSSKKEHGMTNQIEGVVKQGQNTLVVEDLVSTGKSSLIAVDALRSVGADVKGMLAIFSYDLPIAQSNFKKASCKLMTLSDFPHLIKVAEEENYIQEKELKSLEEWRKDPEKWSAEHS